MESQKNNTRQPVRGTMALALVFSAVLIALAKHRFSVGTIPDIVPFLGHFHPLIVHLPIGFILALFLLEIFDLTAKSVKLHHATFIVAWLAAGSAVVSAIFGVLLSYTGEYGADLLWKHLWLGTATAVLSLWIVVFKMRSNWREEGRFSFVYHGLVFATTAALTMAGHYGGALTHGSDYLTSNMPGKLRMILGVSGPKKNTPDKVVGQNPLDQIVYASAIEPIFKDKCVNCHGPEKQENKLRLDSYADAMKGGKTGSNIVAKASAESFLITSLHLPKDDKKHMPPDGKPQLSSDDIALLAWWIDQGAADKAKFSDVKISRTIARILHDRVGLAAPGGGEIAMQKPEQILPVAQKIASEIGFNISPISATDAGLQLAYIIGGKKFGDEEAAKIVPLKSNLVRLDLGGSAITDTGLVQIAELKNLKRLDLNRTAITDAGVAKLAALQGLEYLNLYGTKVTDASLEPLKQISSLRKVYLWQTAVTTNALADFEKSFVDEGQLAEWKKEIAELQSKIETMGVDANIGASTAPEVPASTNAAPAMPAKPAAAK